MFVSSIAYRSTDGQLCWCLDSQFVWLRAHGFTYKRFKCYVQEVIGIRGYTMRPDTRSPGRSPFADILPIASTPTLLTSIWMTVEKTKTNSLELACLRALKRIASTICTHWTDANSTISVETQQSSLSMDVTQHGQLHGLAAVILSMPHGAMLESVSQCWDEMYRAGELSEKCVRRSHLVSDVIYFVASFKKWRGRKKRAQLSVEAKRWLSDLRRGIVQWLAHGMDYYTIHEYPKTHDVHKKPPSHVESGGRVRPHPDAIWSMLEVANTTSLSLPQVLQVRSDDADAGASRRTSSRWEALQVAMYLQRTCQVWKTVDHVCITADGSTHAYEDAFLAIAFSWQLNQSCYPPLQYIVPGMA